MQEGTDETGSTQEYDGGRDISAVLEAAGREESSAPAETPAPGTPAPTASAPVTTSADAQAAVARAYKMFLGDQEVTDLEKITAKQLLDEVQFGYKANKAEQKRNFEGLLRNAQQGHHNETVRQRLE